MRIMIFSIPGYFRFLAFAPLLAGVFLLAACSSTSGQKPGVAASSRIDAALEQGIADAQARGAQGEALALLEQAHARMPEDRTLAIRYARALREDEQINRARSILAPFVQDEDKKDKDKQDSGILTEMAMIYLALGQYKDAELRARDAVVLAPEDGRAFLALGTALDAQGYHQQAEVAFRRGLEYWKDDPTPILNNLALNLASQGYLAESLSILQKAKKIAPNRIEIERNLRIISALQETAGPTAPKPSRKPQLPEKSTKKSVPVEAPAKEEPVAAQHSSPDFKVEIKETE